MSFTLLSAALLLCVGACVIPKALRGYRQGLARSAISLSAVVFSALAAVPLAVWLSDYPADLAAKYLPRLIPVITRFTTQFPSLELLIPAALDAVIAPFMFVLFYLVIRGLVCAPLEGLLRKLLSPRPHDPADPIYESRKAPWHRRHTRLLGGITGGIRGFVVSVILLTPLLGVLSVADTALATAVEIKVKWSAYNLTTEDVALMQDLVDDPVANLLEATGGGMLFDATATTDLRDTRIFLREEVDYCADLLVDAMGSVGALRNMEHIIPSRQRILAGLGDKIERSEVAKLVAADAANRAAEAWLEDQPFMGVPAPTFNEHLEPLRHGLLEVFAAATPDCVARDISTVVDICLITSNSGLITGKLSYQELAAGLDSGGAVDLIYGEIMDNPCTSPLAGKMTEVALRLMATALEESGFDELRMKSLMTHLSDSMNRINGMGISGPARVEHMTEYISYYTKMYGVKVPDSMAEIAAVAFVEKLGATGKKITADQMYGLLEQYMKK